MFSDVFGVNETVEKLAWADELGVALSAAQLAASLIRTSGARRVVNVKGVNDFASEVDLRVEEAVVRFLTSSSKYPVQGEEFTPKELSSSRWVVDPIDGTFNFVADVPIVAFNIALLVDGVPVVAVTSSVQSDEVFWATRGGGTFLNGQRVHVSENSVTDSVFLSGDFTVASFGPWASSRRTRAIVGLVGAVGRMRMVGSAATDLAWVAAGRASGSVLFSNRPWDACAGVLLVHEAGGVVTDALGEPWSLESDSVLSANSFDTSEVVSDRIRFAVSEAKEILG